MTVEYVLLLSLFVLFFMGAIIKGPTNAFNNAGPKLGARVEQNLMTGTGWKHKNNDAVEWRERN